MYEDEPQDRVHDILAEAVFGDHPLGRRVLGEAEVIGSIPVPDIEAYRSARYTGANVVVGAAGHVDHERIAELAERLVSPAGRRATAQRRGRAPTTPPRLRFYEKDTEQYHICFGAPGITRDDERRYALAVLDSIFGGSSSSRLFREVREKRGLAYAVGSYSEQYTDSGLVATYVGTREDNVEEACSIIGAELARLRSEPVSAEELARGQGERQGPPRALLGVDRGADDADLPRDPLRPADRQPRRDAGQGRRGQRRRPDRARRRALRRRAALGRLRRPRREPLPRGARPRSARAWSPHDPGRRLRRRRAHGPGRLRGGRGRRGHGAGRARPTPRSASSSPTCSATPTSSSTSPRPTPPSPTPRPASRPASTSSSAPPASTSTRCARPPRPPARRNCFVAPNFAIGAVLLMEVAQKIAPHMPECEIVELHHDKQARRPLGHGEAHRRADRGRRRQRPRADPLGPPAGPGRPPGGHLRRRGPDAEHPPRLDRPPLLHARRAARGAARSAACPTASRSAWRSCFERRRSRSRYPGPMKEIRGVLTAMATPFERGRRGRRGRGADAWRRYLLEHGSHGLVVSGYDRRVADARPTSEALVAAARRARGGRRRGACWSAAPAPTTPATRSS